MDAHRRGRTRARAPGLPESCIHLLQEQVRQEEEAVKKSPTAGTEDGPSKGVSRGPVEAVEKALETFERAQRALAEVEKKVMMKESSMPCLACPQVNVSLFKTFGRFDRGGRKLVEPGCGATTRTPGSFDPGCKSSHAGFLSSVDSGRDTGNGGGGGRRRGVLGQGGRSRTRGRLRGSTRTRRTTTRECLAAEEVLASVHMSVSRRLHHQRRRGRASRVWAARAIHQQCRHSDCRLLRCISPRHRTLGSLSQRAWALPPSAETPPDAMLRHHRWCGRDVFPMPSATRQLHCSCAV